MLIDALNLLVRLLWMPTAGLLLVGVIASRIRLYRNERRTRMDSAELPWIEHQQAAARKRAAALDENNERLQPYGPPPPLVDAARWSELTESVYLGQFLLGLDLRHWQVRNFAAFLADRMFADAPATRGAVAAR
ncbi:hypothetical protein AB0L97_32760 [Nocardia sp. NPDC051911]|uniref:hypothetical protein n=1 Tax=Nocardia sp. NPDC051911 TaxID=3154648 RepID=UPI003440E667